MKQMHFIRAQQLADRLVGRVRAVSRGSGQVREDSKGDDAAARYVDILYGKRGLIFIKDYWTRSGESGRKPDRRPYRRLERLPDIGTLDHGVFLLAGVLRRLR